MEKFKGEVHHGGLRLLRIPTNLFGLPTKYKDEVSNCYVAAYSYQCRVKLDIWSLFFWVMWITWSSQIDRGL